MAATILAAGLGRRLGNRPKAALMIDGISLLERLIDALRGAGIAHMSVVVGGAHAPTLLPLVARSGARALPHALADSSLIDSQRLALQGHDAHHRDHDLALVLADLPWLEPAHIGALRDAWQSRPTDIQAQMPVVDGVRGHPLMMSAKAVQRVLATPAEAGIRDWLAAHPQWVRAVPTSQRAHVSDLDTPQDLARLEACFGPQAVAWPD